MAPKIQSAGGCHLAMVKNIDKSIPKGEKQQADQIKAKIDDLKKSKLVLPVSKEAGKY